MEADAARPNGHTVALLGRRHTQPWRRAGERRGQPGTAPAHGRAHGRRHASRRTNPDLVVYRDVIGNWDTVTLVDRLELRVGRDLQYVRMNGTLVGFLVGGAAYAVLIAIFGHAAF